MRLPAPSTPASASNKPGAGETITKNQTQAVSTRFFLHLHGQSDFPPADVASILSTMDRIEKLCAERGMRMTEQRRVIARVLSNEIAERLGFELVGHKLELYGKAVEGAEPSKREGLMFKRHAARVDPDALS
jgi:hypothetical protein